MTSKCKNNAFTLIELSIVLVIIGLIVGGVLVGRDLISAAGVRAQISQIEKYQQAVNTFRGKYGYLPGDISRIEAAKFGFAARGVYPGQGDGNGVISGNIDNSDSGDCVTSVILPCPFSGEGLMFWVDLSTAKLIDGGFTLATATAIPVSINSATFVKRYFPQSKLGNGFVYVWNSTPNYDGNNYFGVSIVHGDNSTGHGNPLPNFTVSQAYAIDNKIDDGLPQYGTVLAWTAPSNQSGYSWAVGGNPITGGGIPYLSASGDFDPTTGLAVTNAANIGEGMTAGQYSCYDGSGGLPEKYSINQNNGNGVNCWLSFKFQ